MKKRILVLLLALVTIISLTACDDATIGIIGGADGPTSILIGDVVDILIGDDADNTSNPATENPRSHAPPIDEDGWYYSAEDVALYIHTYGYLPGNFITKNEANDLGWTGGSVEKYAPGYAIGGDTFGNREGILPKAKGRKYYECDIDTDGKNSRGAKRIVFSNDGLIYYTEDHYESFELLYGGND